MKRYPGEEIYEGPEPCTGECIENLKAVLGSLDQELALFKSALSKTDALKEPFGEQLDSLLGSSLKTELIKDLGGLLGDIKKPVNSIEDLVVAAEKKVE